jgi:hypothetical protein
MNLTIKGGKEPGRNEPCPCKSGLKFKQCHGDPVKRAVCESVMAETMLRLIMQEKHKRGMIADEQLEMILNPADNLNEEDKIINPFGGN